MELYFNLVCFFLGVFGALNPSKKGDGLIVGAGMACVCLVAAILWPLAIIIITTLKLRALIAKENR